MGIRQRACSASRPHREGGRREASVTAASRVSGCYQTTLAGGSRGLPRLRVSFSSISLPWLRPGWFALYGAHLRHCASAIACAESHFFFSWGGRADKSFGARAQEVPRASHCGTGDDFKLRRPLRYRVPLRSRRKLDACLHRACAGLARLKLRLRRPCRCFNSLLPACTGGTRVFITFLPCPCSCLPQPPPALIFTAFVPSSS